MIHVNRALTLLLLAGCSGSPSATDAGLEADAAFDSDAGIDSDAGFDVDSGTTTGATVYVHLVSSHDPVPHAPATAGQTPRDWVSGIRSLHLLRSQDDPAPFEVFSHGDGFVEASYADGADTIVGSRSIAELEPGTFTWARAVHTHVRFTIDATLHAGFGPMPGEVEDLIVLSDRTTIDSVEWDRGDYRFTFRTGGMAYPTEGSGFELAPISGGGFNVRVEEGETAYYFPAYLVVNDELTADVHLMFEVNVHEGFRWTDTAVAAYQTGVFDMTPLGTEPIVQAGANSYSYRVSGTDRP